MYNAEEFFKAQVFKSEAQLNMYQKIDSYTIKLVGDTCNLRCKYCYYQEHNMGLMNLLNVRKLIGSIANYAVLAKEQFVNLTWHGGEPMLYGLDNYKKIIDMQKSYPDVRFLNRIQTNATLINDEWCEFFKENGFRVGVSFDIDREAHNMNRDNSYDLVEKSIILLKSYNIPIGTLSVCSELLLTKQPKDLIDKLLNLKVENFDFKPVYDKKVNDEYIQNYEKFIIGLVDYFLEIDNPNLNFRLLYAIIDKVVGSEGAGLCVFNPKCGNFPSIDSKGRMSICDNYDSRNINGILGNVFETDLNVLMNSEHYYRIRSKFDGFKRRNTCENCDVRYICNGGCPNNSDLKLEEFLYCKAYKGIFKYVENLVLASAIPISQRTPR
jgi:uncharacterized protein